MFEMNEPARQMSRNGEHTHARSKHHTPASSPRPEPVPEEAPEPEAPPTPTGSHALTSSMCMLCFCQTDHRT